MATTVYDIQVKYALDDRASRGMRTIADQAQRSAKETDRLGASLKRLATGAAGFLGFQAARKHLIGYNSELEQARIQMTGLLQLNMGGAWAANQRQANSLVRQFQKDAKASVGTTKDFVDMGSMLVGPLSSAGASIDDIAKVTKGAVIASRAFGIEASMAALDIEQALAGTLSKKDRFARSLLEPMKLTTDSWNAMVKETPGKAAGMLLKAFNQPAIRNMAVEQGKSWAGVMSTLEDSLQRTFGRVGLPLMKRITKEVEKLNAWFDANPQRVTAIAQDLGSHLVKAFEMAKGVFGFVVEHKTLLLTMAKAFLVSRAAGGMASMFAGMGQGLAGLNQTATGAGGKLAAFGSKLGTVTTILGGVAIAAQGVADALLAEQDKSIKARQKFAFEKDVGRVLGGAMVGAGTGIGRNLFLEQQARARGFSPDEGSITAARRGAGGAIQAGARMAALAAGRFSAADKMQGLALARNLERSGLAKGGKIDVAAVAGAFGAGRSGAFNRAKFGAGGAQAFSALSISEMATRLEAENVRDNNQRITQMAQFLRGAERAMIIRGREMPEAGRETAESKPSKRRRASGTQVTNVTVSNIEVVSDDPDRFAMAMVGAFQDYAKSPTQAARVIREG